MNHLKQLLLKHETKWRSGIKANAKAQAASERWEFLFSVSNETFIVTLRKQTLRELFTLGSNGKNPHLRLSTQLSEPF